MTKTYKVIAKRWDHGWELDVAGVGVTQTRTLARAERDAQDYIAMLTNDSDPIVMITPDLGAFAEKVNQVRSAQESAQRILAESAALTRTLVEDFRGAGLTGGDIAKLLNVTPQRVSQLSKSS